MGPTVKVDGLWNPVGDEDARKPREARDASSTTLCVYSIAEKPLLFFQSSIVCSEACLFFVTCIERLASVPPVIPYPGLILRSLSKPWLKHGSTEDESMDVISEDRVLGQQFQFIETLTSSENIEVVK